MLKATHAFVNISDFELSTCLEAVNVKLTQSACFRHRTHSPEGERILSSANAKVPEASSISSQTQVSSPQADVVSCCIGLDLLSLCWEAMKHIYCTLCQLRKSQNELPVNRKQVTLCALRTYANI